MKRRQKRYESEQEILDTIEHAKARIKDFFNKAVLEQHLTRTCKGCLDHDHADNAKKALTSMSTIEQTKLPRLKNALAAFRTQPMTFCGEDKGVVLEPLK